MSDVSNSEADKNLRVKCVCVWGGGGGIFFHRVLKLIILFSWTALAVFCGGRLELLQSNCMQ